MGQPAAEPLPHTQTAPKSKNPKVQKSKSPDAFKARKCRSGVRWADRALALLMGAQCRSCPGVADDRTRRRPDFADADAKQHSRLSEVVATIRRVDLDQERAGPRRWREGVSASRRSLWQGRHARGENLRRVVSWASMRLSSARPVTHGRVATDSSLRADAHLSRP